MENSFGFTDYPEIVDLYSSLLDKVLNESARGAVLIITADIEDYLSSLIEVAFPQKMTKKQKEKLLTYPGHLSSFSAKIELAYAFRIIDKTLYDSLNSLRKIRNDAAHSNINFDFQDLEDKMNNIYDLGPNIPSHFRNVAIQLMLKYKFDNIKEGFEKDNIDIERQREIIQHIISNKETIHKLEQQSKHWQLIIGTCFICTILLRYKQNLLKLTERYTTWSMIDITKVN